MVRVAWCLALGDLRLVASGWRRQLVFEMLEFLELCCSRLAAGGPRPAAGGWSLAAGGWRVASGGQPPAASGVPLAACGLWLGAGGLRLAAGGWWLAAELSLAELSLAGG